MPDYDYGCAIGPVICLKAREKANRPKAQNPSTAGYPATAVHSRHYLIDETLADRFVEYEVTKFANRTAGYTSTYMFAGQVSVHVH